MNDSVFGHPLSPPHSLSLRIFIIINYLSVCFSDCMYGQWPRSTTRCCERYRKTETWVARLWYRFACRKLFSFSLTFLNRISLSATISRMFIFRVCFFVFAFNRRVARLPSRTHMWDICFIHTVCAIAAEDDVTVAIVVVVVVLHSERAVCTSQYHYARIYCVTQSRFVAMCVSVCVKIVLAE